MDLSGGNGEFTHRMDLFLAAYSEFAGISAPPQQFFGFRKGKPDHFAAQMIRGVQFQFSEKFQVKESCLTRRHRR